MSASRNDIPWKSISTRPNCRRSIAQPSATSSAFCAIPTAQAAIPSRPPSRAARAILKPWPSSPISRSAPIRASSKRICAVVDALNPILRSGSAAETPSVVPSTSRQEIPREPSSDVRHSRL